MLIKITINLKNLNKIFFEYFFNDKYVSYFLFDFMFWNSEIWEFGIINFFLNPSIFLSSLCYSPLQHLITVVITLFLAYTFLVFFAFNLFSLKLEYFSKIYLSVILYFLIWNPFVGVFSFVNTVYIF